MLLLTHTLKQKCSQRSAQTGYTAPLCEGAESECATAPTAAAVRHTAHVYSAQLCAASCSVVAACIPVAAGSLWQQLAASHMRLAADMPSLGQANRHLVQRVRCSPTPAACRHTAQVYYMARRPPLPLSPTAPQQKQPHIHRPVPSDSSSSHQCMHQLVHQGIEQPVW